MTLKRVRDLLKVEVKRSVLCGADGSSDWDPDIGSGQLEPPLAYTADSRYAPRRGQACQETD